MKAYDEYIKEDGFQEQSKLKEVVEKFIFVILYIKHYVITKSKCSSRKYNSF